ncbi:MAG: phosphotransferase [Chloroflexota bacterium]|nr:phosphotransferase [Chloroflexota bacterium]
MRPSGVTLDDARDFLEARGAVTDIAPVDQQGMWSRAFRFREHRRDLIIRFAPDLETFDKDAFVARRAPPDLAVPEMVERGLVFDGHYAITERARGRMIDGLDGDGMRRVLPSVLRTLDAVRRIDLSDTHGYDLWDADGNGRHATWRHSVDVLDEAAGWRERIAESPIGTLPFDRTLERVRMLSAYCPEERYLVHSDLLHFNVLVDGDQVSALLDWGSSLIGDFVYDIAWLEFWKPWYPAWRHIDFAGEALRHYASTGLAMPHFIERLRCYELCIALSNMVWFASRDETIDLERTARRAAEV